MALAGSPCKPLGPAVVQKLLAGLSKHYRCASRLVVAYSATGVVSRATAYSSAHDVPVAVSATSVTDGADRI